jgi:hypothetical protein
VTQERSDTLSQKENKDKYEIKQAPETREDGLGERDEECRHESHENWREQRFVANNFETNASQTRDNQSKPDC